MYAWTMLTEFNLQSSTRVKNAVVFYYIHVILHTIAMSACSIVLSIFIMKCMLKFPYLNYLKSLTSQFSTGLLARRNLCTAASRASGSAAKWCWLHYDEAQDAVFCFICALSQWYNYLCTYMVSYSYSTGIYTNVLLWKYSQQLASIRRDLTRSLSFIIVIVGFLES